MYSFKTEVLFIIQGGE